MLRTVDRCTVSGMPAVVPTSLVEKGIEKSMRDVCARRPPSFSNAAARACPNPLQTHAALRLSFTVGPDALRAQTPSCPSSLRPSFRRSSTR
eukprot:1960682-Prymnesium_polylepis.1